MPTPTPRLTGPILALLVLFSGCDTSRPGDPEGMPVARAGSHYLTVEEAASLLSDQSQLQVNQVVVRAVADLWIDYTLLGEAARRDPTLQSVDLEPILAEQLERRLVLAYRDSVVDPDTTFSEEELRDAYRSGSPEARIRARHILLSFPEGATEAQRDSVERLARELRRRAREGEDFGELARRYSDDAGSASRGGDLGTFGRGEMVPAFEEAAFALEPGEISQPVETPYGLHLIRVESREAPDFESNRDRFASQLRQRRIQRAESALVADIEEPADIRVEADAYEVVRQIAARPGASLSPRARRRALVSYEGGALAAGELRTFFQGLPLQQRIQLQQSSRDQLEGVLRNLTRRELLAAEARASGLRISGTERDSLRSQLHARLEQLVGGLGLDTISVREGEDASDAVDRVVGELLARTITGQQQVVPLGSLAFTLRRDLGAEIFPAGVSRVVERLAPEDSAAAGSPPSPGADGSSPAPRDPAPADTRP